MPPQIGAYHSNNASEIIIDYKEQFSVPIWFVTRCNIRWSNKREFLYRVSSFFECNKIFVANQHHVNAGYGIWCFTNCFTIIRDRSWLFIKIFEYFLILPNPQILIFKTKFTFLYFSKRFQEVRNYFWHNQKNLHTNTFNISMFYMKTNIYYCLRSIFYCLTKLKLRAYDSFGNSKFA